MLRADSPPPITDATAQKLYQRLSVCYATEDLLPICNSLAVIEECKQHAFSCMASSPNEAITELLRLIALQQSLVTQIMGKESDSRP